MKMILCLCTVILLAGCQMTAPSSIADPDIPSEAATQEQAVSIATSSFEQEGFGKKYDLSKPARVIERPDHWQVFFRELNDAGENDQDLMIYIRKKTE